MGEERRESRMREEVASRVRSMMPGTPRELMLVRRSVSSRWRGGENGAAYLSITTCWWGAERRSQDWRRMEPCVAG